MKLGVFGGTFDPPHLGHLAAARFAIEALGLDQLLLVPAAVPPHKELPENAPAPEDRLSMTVIAADNMFLPKRVAVDDLELRREGKSYTSDTLRELHGQYPDAELYLLMGTDMFLTLQDWHEPAEIVKLAHLAAFARTQADTGEMLSIQADYLRRTFGADVTVLQLPEIVPVSSTELREGLAKGEGSRYLPPAVYGYILRQGLYGTHADLARLTDDQLRACSYSMMLAKRIPHVGGVESEAVKMAERWGADPVLARRAAILHDCTKYYNLEQQLQICDEYGIVLDDLERASVKLLHAKTGACMAKHLYGQPEEVFWAIFWHTTGKADMSLLEKVLYLADYMEPNRDFPGVDDLRRLSYEDIDKALLMGLEMSVEDLNERGVPIHKNTQEALDWLKGSKRG